MFFCQNVNTVTRRLGAQISRRPAATTMLAVAAQRVRRNEKRMQVMGKTSNSSNYLSN